MTQAPTQNREPSTAGMKAHGYYDLHSEYQRRVIEQGNDLLHEAMKTAEFPKDDSAFTIADYGSGTGATSAAAMLTAISTLRDRDASVPIRTVHNDVLTNDFNQLFHVASGSEGYLDYEGGPIYLTAAGGSFFDQVVPSETVQVGMCSNAAHWYRVQPHVAVPDGMYFCEAHGQSRDELAQLAADDWTAFLTARAAELTPGGKFVQQGIGRVGSGAQEKVSGARLLRTMSAVATALSKEGLLDGEILERYVFPVYCRSEEELVAPMSPGGTLADQLEVTAVRVEEVANPYWEKFERDNDLDAYVESFMEFTHAWADTTMLNNLFEPGARQESPEKVAALFFDRLTEAIRRDPAASSYDAWVIRLLLTRRD